MIDIHLDFETRSACNLKRLGHDRYAEDPSTSILCAAYKIEGEDEIHVWLPGQPTPECFKNDYHLIAHNAAFEYAIIKNKTDMHWKIPKRVTCTMTSAMQRNLPAALTDVGLALGLSTQKSQEGRKLMLKLCKYGYQETPEELLGLIAYCVQDVRVEAEVHRLLPPIESDLIQLDLKINSRGIKADKDLAAAILEVVDAQKTELQAELIALTGGEVRSGQQVAKLLAWLQRQGYPYNDLREASVSRAIEERPIGITNSGYRALQIRENWALGSIGKYKSILDSLCEGDRVKGLFQLAGAQQTGRWAGRRVQLQNLPRLTFTADEIDLAVSLFMRRDSASLKLLFGDVFSVAKQLIRPTFIASRRRLVVSDFSQIECRVLAWLVDQEELLAEFRKPKNRVYELMASLVYHVPVEQVTKIQRQVGKECILGAGYGLGSNGFFELMQRRRVEVSFDECDSAIRTFRSTFANIRNFWYRFEEVFCSMVQNPGYEAPYGKLKLAGYPIGGKTSVTITLPSGRKLYFHNCELRDSTYGKQIWFRNSKCLLTSTYGGKLTENIVQGIARDLIADRMLCLDKQDFEIVGHVHDEVILDNCDEADGILVNTTMSTVPDWADGLPLAAETHLCDRYTK